MNEKYSKIDLSSTILIDAGIDVYIHRNKINIILYKELNNVIDDDNFYDCIYQVIRNLKYINNCYYYNFNKVTIVNIVYYRPIISNNLPKVEDLFPLGSILLEYPFSKDRLKELIIKRSKLSLSSSKPNSKYYKDYIDSVMKCFNNIVYQVPYFKHKKWKYNLYNMYQSINNRDEIVNNILIMLKNSIVLDNNSDKALDPITATSIYIIHLLIKEYVLIVNYIKI